MSFINFSKPTQAQVVHGAERAIAAFAVTGISVWHLNGDQFTKAALVAAAVAGATAAYQLVISTFTNL